MGTLHENLYRFMIASRRILLRMRNLSDEFVEKNETRILSSVTLLRKSSLYEIMWKNTVQPERPQMTIWRMRIASWILNTTNTHSQYVILVAFQLQQWLHERTSILRYTYIACCHSALWDYFQRLLTWTICTCIWVGSCYSPKIRNRLCVRFRGYKEISCTSWKESIM
jgi:hypothetical protein